MIKTPTKPLKENSLENPLMQKGKMEQVTKFTFSALVLTFLMTLCGATGMLPTLASSGALNNVMNIVIGIISDAAFYIGIIIVLWGAFQIILAFRREDSEGISKQITTVVVGGVLVGFGAIAERLYSALR